MLMFVGIFKDLRILCRMRQLKYINYLRPVEFNRKLHTISKIEYFPFHEINDVKCNHLNCDEEKWNEIVAEVLQGKEEGKNFPQFLCMRNLEDLVECHSHSQRCKYLLYLSRKEKLRIWGKEKKCKNIEQKSTNPTNKSNSGHIEYGLGKNSLLLAFRKPSFRKYFDKKLANSVLFGQKMVFDLSYNDHMWIKERRNCAAQLRLVHSVNRQHCDPFDLYYCNAKMESHCVKYLLEEMPSINEPLVSLTEQSYLDIFPKESLVYLSPHASETLTTFDHNAVYIIGAFVDTVKREHLSLERAHNEGIKCYSLPLDKYVLWGSGTRSLSINQAFSIMLTLRDTGDWKEAFKHIPTRKLRRIDANQSIKEHDSEKMYLIKN